MTGRMALAMCAAIGALVCAAVSVDAQTLAPGRIEIGGGLLWTGREPLGTRAANETTSSGAPTPLFSTSTVVVGAPGVEARIGYRVTQRLEAEAIGSFGAPRLETTITADVEAPGAVTAAERTHQFTVGGGALWYLTSARLHGRLMPFVVGSAQYLRQLHEGSTLAVAGQSFDIGGGVKVPIATRTTSRLKSFGVRADVRARARRNGVAFDSDVHVSPAVGAAVYARF